MHQRFFGESRDIIKRQLMTMLVPGTKWHAHPMWYGNRTEEPQLADFLKEYADAMNVTIAKGGDSKNPPELVQATKSCTEHLFLDPDTGLGKRTSKNRFTHVDYDDFIQIVKDPARKDRLTLIYDQGYSRAGKWDDFEAAICRKVKLLREHNIHAVGYLAELSVKLAFIWASVNRDLVRTGSPSSTTKGIPGPENGTTSKQQSAAK